MSSIGKSRQALHRWVIDNSHIHAGPSRKLYVRAGSDDPSRLGH